MKRKYPSQFLLVCLHLSDGNSRMEVKSGKTDDSRHNIGYISDYLISLCVLLLKRGTLFPLLCKLPSPKPEIYLKLPEGFLKSKSIILSYSYCWVRIKSIAEGVIKSDVVTKIQI